MDTPVFAHFTDEDRPLRSDSLLHGWIADSIARVTSSTSPPSAASLPPSPSSFFSFYRAHSALTSRLQSALNQQASKNWFIASLTAAAEMKGKDAGATLARLTAITAPMAAVWKITAPINDNSHLTLPDAHYRLAARMNLGSHPFHNTLPLACPSCTKHRALAKDSWHFLSCNHWKRRQVTVRHDAVANALWSYVNTIGGMAMREPGGLVMGDQRRPDLLITFPGQQILTDVVVSHPLCPTHRLRACTKHAAVAEFANAKKQEKYEAAAATQHARLLPFSVETTSGMARGAIELLEQVSLACRDTLTVWPHWQIEMEMQKAVAVAVQKGNAMIMLAGYNAAVMPTWSTKVVNRMEDNGQ
jgi:hypothetical protein